MAAGQRIALGEQPKLNRFGFTEAIKQQMNLRCEGQGTTNIKSPYKYQEGKKMDLGELFAQSCPGEPEAPVMTRGQGLSRADLSTSPKPRKKAVPRTAKSCTSMPTPKFKLSPVPKPAGPSKSKPTSKTPTARSKVMPLNSNTTSMLSKASSARKNSRVSTSTDFSGKPPKMPKSTTTHLSSEASARAVLSHSVNNSKAKVKLRPWLQSSQGASTSDRRIRSSTSTAPSTKAVSTKQKTGRRVSSVRSTNKENIKSPKQSKPSNGSVTPAQKLQSQNTNVSETDSNANTKSTQTEAVHAGSRDDASLQGELDELREQLVAYEKMIVDKDEKISRLMSRLRRADDCISETCDSGAMSPAHCPQPVDHVKSPVPIPPLPTAPNTIASDCSPVPNVAVASSVSPVISNPGSTSLEGTKALSKVLLKRDEQMREERQRWQDQMQSLERRFDELHETLKTSSKSDGFEEEIYFEDNDEMKELMFRQALSNEHILCQATSSASRKRSVSLHVARTSSDSCSRRQTQLQGSDGTALESHQRIWRRNTLSSTVDLRPAKQLTEHRMSGNLHLLGLHANCTNDDLRNLCSRFGLVMTAKVIVDPISGSCKGEGFVKYSNRAMADIAIDQLGRSGIQAEHINNRKTSLLHRN